VKKSDRSHSFEKKGGGLRRRKKGESEARDAIGLVRRKAGERWSFGREKGGGEQAKRLRRREK